MAEKIQAWKKTELKKTKKVKQSRFKKAIKKIPSTEKSLSSISKYKVKKGRKKERVGGISRRASGTKNILTALGIMGGRAQRSGAGRPTGTFKHGMPIHEWKELQRQKGEQYRQYQQEQVRKFQRRGIAPEQLRQMQLARTVERGMPQQVVMKKGDEPEAMADDELRFKRWEAERTLSPSAQRILLRLRRVQNRGKLDNIRQQRIHEERRIVQDKSNLFRAHENMIKVSMNFAGVDDTNILMAENVFKENPEDNILRSKRPSILNTKDTNNDLFF